VSAGAVVGSQLPTVAHAAPEGGLQGAELRGMYLTTKDPLAEGRFGAMFKKLPAFAPSDDLLTSLAQTMVETDTSDVFLFLAKAGQNLFAGFTFIGQFIDHDITLHHRTPFAGEDQIIRRAASNPPHKSSTRRRGIGISRRSCPFVGPNVILTSSDFLGAIVRDPAAQEWVAHPDRRS